MLHLPAGALKKMDGIAARLFRLAQSADPEEAEALAAPLLERLKDEGFEGLRDAVMQWIRHVLPAMPASRRPCRNTRHTRSLST